MSAREQFGDPQFERLQIRIRNLEFAMNRVPFLNGVLVEDVALTTASKQVANRLGRGVRGFFVVSVTPDAAIGLSSTQPTDANYVNLEASATCTADIWFW